MRSQGRPWPSGGNSDAESIGCQDKSFQFSTSQLWWNCTKTRVVSWRTRNCTKMRVVSWRTWNCTKMRVVTCQLEVYLSYDEIAPSWESSLVGYLRFDVTELSLKHPSAEEGLALEPAGSLDTVEVDAPNMVDRVSLFFLLLLSASKIGLPLLDRIRIWVPNRMKIRIPDAPMTFSRGNLTQSVLRILGFFPRRIHESFLMLFFSFFFRLFSQLLW